MILLTLGTLFFGGALVASSRKMENDGGGSYPPSFDPPRHTPQPQYGGSQYGQYDDQEDGHSPGYNFATREVRIRSKDGQFWTVAQYSTISMEFKVDTGANDCVIGDKAYSYLRRAIGNEMRSTSASVANGEAHQAWSFTFPYLTVGAITLQEVECVYIPGGQRNLLGMSFLGRCNMSMRGNEMTLSV